MKLRSITEELTANTKSMLDSTGYETIESYEAFGYEIFLFQHEQGFYQIALQKSGRDFGDRDQQFEKRKLDYIPPYMQLPKLLKLVKTWREKYSPIYFGTPNASRAKKYANILQRFGIIPEKDDFSQTIERMSGQTVFKIG